MSRELRWRFRESVRAEGEAGIDVRPRDGRAEIVARVMRIAGEPYEDLELFVRGGAYSPDRYVILDVAATERVVAMLGRALIVMRAQKALADALPRVDDDGGNDR